MQKSTGRFHCAMRALAVACLALSGSALSACARRPSPSPNASGLSAGDTLDVLIAGGTVHDGLRPEARRVDVGLRGDRVVSLGAVPRGVVVKRRIDAEGLIVAPGFIDPHTHAYEGLPRLGLERRKNIGALMQGVTTVVLGADGRGPIDVRRVLDSAAVLGLGTNTYAMTGFGTVRSRVLGASSAAATPAQIDSMRALIAQAMAEGAFGVGSGLFYAPQSYATTDEVLAVVSAAKPFGGVYDTHQRDESSYTIGLFASVQEAIRIGCGSGLTTNIGHIKTLGVDVWGKADSVLAIMAAARSRGCRVTADQYPWTASGTGLSAALLPRWAQAGGRDSMLARMADDSQRARMLEEVRENLRRRGGDSTLLLTGGGVNARPYIGRTLRDVALARGLAPDVAAVTLIQEGADMSVASFNMIEDDIVRFMRDPFVMTSSDGSDGHPRLYGTYPRKLRHYVLERGVISMARMVEASSAQVARVYGLSGRGELRPGAYADVIVFDPRAVRDEATYVEPTRLATGMRWVFVNGVSAVEDGQPTGALAGRALRRR